MDWAEKLDDLLQKYIPQMKVIAEEPMSRHTTFRIGGAADYFAYYFCYLLCNSCLSGTII